MRGWLAFLLIAGTAWAEEPVAPTNEVVVLDSLSQTNNAEVAKAVKAMVVDEKEPSSKATQAAEAAEVAEIVRKKKETISQNAETSKPNVDPWETFAPPPDTKFDWLQLTSGEWLKGDFKVMYDFKLEFDSDEMGLQEFDFEDVKQLRTRSMKSVFFEGEDGPRDSSVLRGLLVIKGDQVKLIRSEHEVVIPRERVVSIAGGKESEREKWSGTASVGINLRGGNTETLDITVIANLMRRTARTRFNADYLANYSANTQVNTADNQRLSGYLDWFFTSRFYWKTMEAEYYRDPFSNIGRQSSFSSGVGYDFIHTPRTEWTMNLGAGYQDLRFNSVQEGDPTSSSSPFFTFGTWLDFELTSNIDLLYDYSMRLLNADNGQYTHHMLTTVSIDLISDLDLDISLVWDRIGKPKLDDAGNQPKQDDYQLIISLAYDF